MKQQTFKDSQDNLHLKTHLRLHAFRPAQTGALLFSS